MTLLNDEKMLARLDTGGGALVLTTHRVLHGWDSEFTSIMLEDVGSVVVARLTYRWLLFVTGSCIAMAAYLVYVSLEGGVVPVDESRRIASALLFLSALLVLTFGVKRYSEVRISSAGDRIQFRIRSTIRREMGKFVRDLENAKNRRFFQSDRAREIESIGDILPPRFIPAPKQRRTG
jgi:hypothetical protein